DRAEASVWCACLYNGILLGVISVFFVTFAELVVSAFTNDPQVAPIAVNGLRIISGGFVFYAVGYVLTQAFNGAGDAVTPTWINIGCCCIRELSLQYALSHS